MGQFGSKGPKIGPQDRAILELKLQRDRIQQYQRKLSLISAREYDLAKLALARGEKDKARTALRRRKYHDSLLAKTDAQLETLEQLVSTIEFAQIQEAVAYGLKQGNDVLKQIHSVMSIESVEKLMEDTTEAQTKQREIDEMLSSHMTAEEEDVVQRELAEIEREQQDFVTENPGEEDAVPISVLPTPPSTEPVVTEPEPETEPGYASQTRAATTRAQPEHTSSQPARQALPA